MGEYYNDQTKEGRKKSAIKYTKEKRKRVELNLSLEQYEKWKTAADAAGQPIGTFIKDAVEQCLSE